MDCWEAMLGVQGRDVAQQTRLDNRVEMISPWSWKLPLFFGRLMKLNVARVTCRLYNPPGCQLCRSRRVVVDTYGNIPR